MTFTHPKFSATLMSGALLSLAFLTAGSAYAQSQETEWSLESSELPPGVDSAAVNSQTSPLRDVYLNPLRPGNAEEQAIKRLRRGFNKTQICEDYQVALQILALAHAPQGRHGDNISQQQLQAELANCPTSMEQLVTELRKRHYSLQDFHTAFATGTALDMDVTPTITSCEGNADCGFENTMIYPFKSELKRNLYAFSLSKTKGAQFFEIESVDGKSSAVLFQEALASGLISKTESGMTGHAGQHVLLRQPFDGRDRNDMRIQLRSVRTGERIVVNTTYRPQTPPFGGTFVLPIYEALLGSAQSYGCQEGQEDLYNGSQHIARACVTAKGQSLVRIFEWNYQTDAQGNIIKTPVEFTAEFLDKHKDTLKNPVILDIRGNPGGSPYLAAEWVCTFGDDRSVKEMKRRHLTGGYWPESVTTSSGKTFSLKDILIAPEMGNSNTDLVQSVPGWHVSANAPDAKRREWRMSFFDRAERDSADFNFENECQQARLKEFASTKWVVTTSGREFSATENFLSFIEHSVSRFKIVGETSWGGTGAPTVIQLPNTGMMLRISLARHIDGIDGSFNIEGVGVKPHNFVMRDLKADFERRIRDTMDKTWQVTKGYEYAPYIIRFAHSIRM